LRHYQLKTREVEDEEDAMKKKILLLNQNQNA
jgi:hypothetical protein